MEGKRPYYRYALEKYDIHLDLDLKQLLDGDKDKSMLNVNIRERKNNGAVFHTSNNQDLISGITLFSGEGRRRKERKINLTKHQGQFIFYLPFPNSDHMRIESIMKKAELAEDLAPEILDLINDLISFGIIETKGNSNERIVNND